MLTGGSFEKKGILREIYINGEAKITVEIGTSGCAEIKEDYVCTFTTVV